MDIETNKAPAAADLENGAGNEGAGNSLIATLGSGEGGGQADAGAGGQGDSLITKLGGQGEGAGEVKAAEPAKELSPEEAAALKVPGTPDAYSLSFSEGVNVDAPLLDSFTKAAHELGLNQGQAQKLASFYEQEVNGIFSRVEAAREKELATARGAWQEEIKGDPHYAKKIEQVTLALANFGDQKMYDIMNQTGLGDHPVMFDFLARIGNKLGEVGFKGLGSAARETDPAKLLYPNQM